MTLRCKPGDLAVVIRGSASGTFVEVIELYDDPVYNAIKGVEGYPTWVCHTKGPCLVALVSPYSMRVVGEALAPAGSSVMFKDRDLQPIRPPRQRLTRPAPPVTLEK